MHKTLLAAAMAAACSAAGLAAADDQLPERLERMEQRMRYLEQRVQSQDEAIRAKDRELAELRQGTTGDAGGGWAERIEIGGVVEVEASYFSPDQGDAESDITLATAELVIGARVTEWVSAEVALLYEDDGESGLDVDVAQVTVAPPEGPWFVTAGQFYQPFGVFDSNMVSDPLTLELGEIRESAVAVGFEHNGFAGSVYVFNGDNAEAGDPASTIDHYGATLGYAIENDNFGFSGAIGYLNDLGDSDTVQEAVAGGVGNDSVPDYVAGWFASAVLNIGAFTVIGEYLAATDDFAAGVLGGGAAAAAPAAWNIEAGYAFTLAGKGAVVAVGYQGTAEAEALELPEQRVLTTLSMEIFDSTALSFEWARDNDYDDTESDSLVAQLAVEF
ncbi:MAG: hypothetical protein RLZ44_1514 [Pseudomonadota bacterium]